MKKPLWIILAVSLILLSMVAITIITMDKTAAPAQDTEDLNKDDSEKAGTVYEFDEEGDEVEEGDEDAEEVGEEEADVSPFAGEWLCGAASIYIDEHEGGYDVYIMWDTSDTEESIWEYACTLDGATGALTGKGRKTNETYDEEGEVVSSEVQYTDGSATFTLENDVLIWADAKEDVARGMRFERGEIEELLVEVSEEDADDATEGREENIDDSAEKSGEDDEKTAD